MAYIVGMTLGKHKMFERISPKKSWEGAIGGFVFSIVAAYLISIFYNELTTIQWLIFASLIVVFGTFGDLAESMLKRSLNVKDSSSILPGHGGFLDRFDSLFLAVPAVYLYLQFI
jgi:phosphatidate cytidylyltransferase